MTEILSYNAKRYARIISVSIPFRPFMTSHIFDPKKDIILI